MQELQSSFTLSSFTSQVFISYSYAYSTHSFTSIYLLLSNYKYLPNMLVTPYSLLTNSHFRKEQNLLNLHLLNRQKQQFAIPCFLQITILTK